MKRMLLIAVLLFSATVLMAQNNPNLALVGVVNSAAGQQISAPTTTLTVDVEAVCEQTLCGPYARYAQKYLGVRAPLTDKIEWRIERAAIGLADDTCYQQTPFTAAPTEVVAYAEGKDGLAEIQPDKTSIVAQTLEDAAQQAAQTIFSLRRHRMELITGEAGENVFGEGLKSALEEIARLEQAYLELFLGKRIVKHAVRRFVVTPEQVKRQYVVCRISTREGLLPSSDLTGDMVVLQITPAENITLPIAEAGVKETATVNCLVANPSTCTVQAQGVEHAREVLPIFQYGRTIRVSQPKQR